MPSLADTLSKTSPAGFVPATSPLTLPPVQAMPGQTNSFKVNPWIRSPIPPTNAGPDTLRQFNDGDANVPRRRLLPLPSTVTGSGSGSTVNNTTVISAPSSGASSASISLTAQTVTYISPLLNSGNSSYSALTIPSKSFQLISCNAFGPCEIRLYGTSTAMAADAGRQKYAPPAAELANNIITDLVLDTAPYTWNWQNRIGANSDTPQTTNLYIAVTNLSGPTMVQVNITLLPLES